MRKKKINIQQARTFFDSFCEQNKIAVLFPDARVRVTKLTSVKNRHFILIDPEYLSAEWLPLAFELIDQPFPPRDEFYDILDAEFLERAE